MPKVTEDVVVNCLSEHGWKFERRDIANGVQFTLDDEVRVNFYPTTGRTLVQFGKNAASLGELVKVAMSELQGGTNTPAKTSNPAPNAGGPQKASRRVFIVYGHDVKAREELELLLRRMNFEPVILANLPGVGETIIERLQVLTTADFACVLLTPDDAGGKSGSKKMIPRARQNVVLELGMVLARLGRDRVAILIKGGDIEKPSDIAGLIYIQFTTKIAEVKAELGAALQSAGMPVDVRTLIG